MKTVEDKSSKAWIIRDAIKNKNGPVIILSKIPTSMLQEVLSKCKNNNEYSIEVKASDLDRLKKIGIVLKREEYNAYFYCNTINEAPPSFLVKNRNERSFSRRRRKQSSKSN